MTGTERKRRVEACAFEEEFGQWWWVDGCEHKSPERDFPSWREAMDHALTCGRSEA